MGWMHGGFFLIMGPKSDPFDDEVRGPFELMSAVEGCLQLYVAGAPAG